jgi:asparagine N-glycosylation enzyme membrane subunit Stt3
MASGLDDFKRLLTEFRGLSVWAVGSAVAVPFAAAMIDLSPPWPRGVVLATAVVELVALALVFQFFRSAKRRTINRVLLIGTLVLALVSTVYLTMLSLYTYQVPTTEERFVKGYDCTPEATAVLKERPCSSLKLGDLQNIEYKAEWLWTARSIALIRMTLVLLWFLVFASLSLALGSFLVYQMQAPGRVSRRRPRRAARKPPSPVADGPPSSPEDPV